MHTELKNKIFYMIHTYSIAIQVHVNRILISCVLYSHDSHNAKLPGAHDHEPGLLHQKGQQGRIELYSDHLIFKNFVNHTCLNHIYYLYSLFVEKINKTSIYHYKHAFNSKSDKFIRAVNN